MAHVNALEEGQPYLDTRGGSDKCKGSYVGRVMGAQRRDTRVQDSLEEPHLSQVKKAG